jgi:thioesterase domain-containing protein
MTHDIFDSVAEADPFHLVPFRTSGGGSPLFCFPGAGGNAYVFQEMIAALPEGQPAYAIDMEWLCDTHQDFTVEQLASFYLKVIRRIQKQGPYYFCGYSFGGLVAYEMAMKLIDEGDSASLVALLDQPNPALMSNLSGSDSVRFRRTYLFDRIKKYGRNLVRGDIDVLMDDGLAFVISRAGRFILPLIKIGFRIGNRPLPGKFRANDPAFLKAERCYIPGRYLNSLVCFRVQDRGPEHDHDPSMGWNTCAMGGVEVHVVPGHHVHMMALPYVRAVADKLAAYLDNGSNDKNE